MPRKSGKFERCVASVAKRGGVESPEAVCAASLRRAGWQPGQASNPTLPEALVEGLGMGAGIAAGQAAAEYIRRANPTDAAALSEAWHGRPARLEREVLEASTEPDKLADLGGLEALWVVERDGRHARVIRFGHDVRLAATPDGSQLYLVGGDQALDLNALNVPQAAQARRYVEVGPVWKIEYSATKVHAGDDGPTSWIHEFGEESGEVPGLVYDRVDRRLLLVGGVYSIPIDPDGTSPGLVD